MSKVQISTDSTILLNGKPIGLKVTQSAKGTVVYTPEVAHRKQAYQEHTMPHARYSLAHDNPTSGIPGIHEFGQDIELLLSKLDNYSDLAQ